MEHVTLSEWSRAVIDIGLPTPADLELNEQLRSELERRIELTWLHGGRLEVRTSSWVGVVRLAGATIRVTPKFVGAELGVVQMIEYASGLQALRRLSSRRTIATDGTTLLDFIAHLLADEAAELMRDGLIHDYVTEEESLTALRGTLRFREQATRRFGQLDVLECRYDDFHANVLDNQLVRAGVSVAARLVGDHEVRKKLRRLDVAMSELASTGPLDSAHYRDRLTYDRRNKRYRRAHRLALALLDSAGIKELHAEGPTGSFAFLLDMNTVFEDFVSVLVAEAFADTEWRVRTQHEERSVVCDRRTGKRYSSIVPDIVLDNGCESVPFDCKYKLYGERKVSTSDIYQLFLYAFALADEDTERARAGLIYPAERMGRAPALDIRRSSGPVTASLTGIGLDVPELLRAISDGGAAYRDALESVRVLLGNILTGSD